MVLRFSVHRFTSSIVAASIALHPSSGNGCSPIETLAPGPSTPERAPRLLAGQDSAALSGGRGSPSVRTRRPSSLRGRNSVRVLATGAPLKPRAYHARRRSSRFQNSWNSRARCSVLRHFPSQGSPPRRALKITPAVFSGSRRPPELGGARIFAPTSSHAPPAPGLTRHYLRTIWSALPPNPAPSPPHFARADLDDLRRQRPALEHRSMSTMSI